LDEVKIVSQMIVDLQQPWQVGTSHIGGTSFLVVLFGHQVSISKTLDLTFTGCIWQCRILICLLVDGIVWSSVTFFEVKTHDI
jgi:hypothetical protein